MKAELVNDLKMMEWQLSHIAQALTRARRLEKYREDFHKELHKSILYPSTHYDKVFRDNSGNPSVDVQALRLVEKKERYDKNIQKEYDRHVRWRQLLEWAGPRDRLLLTRYFEKKKSIRPDIINRLLTRVEKRVEEDERRIEWERQKQAIEEYAEYQAKTSAFRKDAIEAGPKKKQYLVDGRYVYMSEEEHKNHLQQEAERMWLIERDMQRPGSKIARRRKELAH